MSTRKNNADNYTGEAGSRGPEQVSPASQANDEGNTESLKVSNANEENLDEEMLDDEELTEDDFSGDEDDDDEDDGVV